MYQLEKINPKILAKISLKHQEKILEQTGSKFLPQKAYDTIKKETQDFTLDLAEAKKVDELFMALLKKNGIVIEESSAPSSSPKMPKTPQEKTGKKTKSKKEEMEFAEKERMRIIDLLELELELEASL
ncbi:hypothetical protein [Aquimarina algiphila]|uniref:Uncharacterized protein n=1 Tax=Aquimarina algiphila TaxID=2047982 RepID=A0A554VB73_9FLAO|nr:hypothetical protein [Aquimarina algiphila]TSE03692.1 hypothetical protein FOF46_28755 [Aquimarina algiphila]